MSGRGDEDIVLFLLSQMLQQLLFPAAQEAVAGTGRTWTNLAVSQHAPARDRRIVRGDQVRGGLNLFGGWRGVFVVAGERDADAARVDPPVARVPADGAILQQPFAGAARVHQPVIGEEDHPVLAKVAGPDWR